VNGAVSKHNRFNQLPTNTHGSQIFVHTNI
jgi:hypothetical protein